MKTLPRLGLLLGIAGSFFVRPALSAVIDFTGGAVTRLSAPTATTTNNTAIWDNVDYYEENGFRLDFIGNTLVRSSFIGDYYHVGNDVIHGHWLGGGSNDADLQKIQITKVGGGTFDLNYFILTSNTDYGPNAYPNPPTAASGLEQTFIQANYAVGPSYTQLLPSETWGFPATQIFLGSQFDGVTSVTFFTNSLRPVECFGMDEFYIDEPPPSQVPDSANMVTLMGLAMGGLALVSRRARTRSPASR